MGPYRGTPIRRDTVLRGEGNLDYVFLEEDNEMGLDGKERTSYANWAEIRRVGNRLIPVLIKALPPNREIFCPMDGGIFSQSYGKCPGRDA